MGNNFGDKGIELVGMAVHVGSPCAQEARAGLLQGKSSANKSQPMCDCRIHMVEEN